MTTITTVRKNGTVAIAADTLTKWGSTKESARYIVNHEKIIRVGDSYVGLAGLASARFMLRDFFDQHADLLPLDSGERIFRAWLELHTALKEKYFVRPGDEEDSVETSQVTAMIVNASGMYMVEEYRTVQALERFYAGGSGREFALGAMYAAYDRPDLSAEDIARLGVEAAAEFDDGTGLPMTAYSVALRE